MYPIVVHKISRQFKEKGPQILKDISFDVREGEVMMLTGPTGSGKSTLLHSMCGYIPSKEGEVVLIGEDVALFSQEQSRRFYAENVGIVSPAIGLLQPLAIRDNLAIPLLCNQTSSSLQKSIIDKALLAFGLSSVQGKFPNELSEGQKRIVLLARAVIHEPKVLLLDDPFQSLDHQTSVKLMTYLRTLAIEKGTAVFMISNDVRLYPFAHRLMKMSDGRIDEIIGDAAVFESPPPYMRI